MVANNSRQMVVQRLHQELNAARSLRASSAMSDAARQARAQLRLFQAQRMARTHADWLEQQDTHDAARFFLDDLYGAHDLTQRDADLERIIPTLEKLLPLRALQAVSDAVAMDALSESLDHALLAHLRGELDATSYGDAYRAMGRGDDRARQIDLVQQLGDALCDLVKIPMLGTTLTLMRRPARLAGLSELHNFLERGFNAFRAMRDPHRFVDAVVARERTILQQLCAGLSLPDCSRTE